MASNQTLSSLPRYSITPPLSAAPTATTFSLSPSSQLSSSSTLLAESSNGSGSEDVSALFAYEPKLLKPFMGLMRIDRLNDPWRHKAYDLHRPLYTGGGSFQHFVEKGRYKRGLASTASMPPSEVAKNQNVLTPQMLNNILNLKSNFKKNYPVLYKSMMNQLTSGKATTISVIPPEVPQQVSHKNLELAAAEINPLESLMNTYEEDFKKIIEIQKQQQQQSFIPDAVVDSYQNAFNYWANPRQQILAAETPAKEEHFITLQPETVTPAPFYDNKSSFWQDQENLPKEIVEEKTFQPADTQHPSSEMSSYWEKREADDLNLPSDKPNQVFQISQPQMVTEPPSVSEDKLAQIVYDKSPSFWENPQIALKDVIEQPVLLYGPQNDVIERNNLWEMPEEIQNDDATNNQSTEIRTSENVENDNNIWEPSVLHKRSSFWAELEEQEEEQENKKHHLDDSEPIFDFNEDFD